MLGYSYEILLAFVFSLFADPNGIRFIDLQIDQMSEIGESHFGLFDVYGGLELLLVHQGTLQI